MLFNTDCRITHSQSVRRHISATYNSSACNKRGNFFRNQPFITLITNYRFIRHCKLVEFNTVVSCSGTSCPCKHCPSVRPSVHLTARQRTLLFAHHQALLLCACNVPIYFAAIGNLPQQHLSLLKYNSGKYVLVCVCVH